MLGVICQNCSCSYLYLSYQIIENMTHTCRWSNELSVLHMFSVKCIADCLNLDVYKDMPYCNAGAAHIWCGNRGSLNVSLTFNMVGLMCHLRCIGRRRVLRRATWKHPERLIITLIKSAQRDKRAPNLHTSTRLESMFGERWSTFDKHQASSGMWAWPVEHGHECCGRLTGYGALTGANQWAAH